MRVAPMPQIHTQARRGTPSPAPPPQPPAPSLCKQAPPERNTRRPEGRPGGESAAHTRSFPGGRKGHPPTPTQREGLPLRDGSLAGRESGGGRSGPTTGTARGKEGRQAAAGRRYETPGLPRLPPPPRGAREAKAGAAGQRCPRPLRRAPARPSPPRGALRGHVAAPAKVSLSAQPGGSPALPSGRPPSARALRVSLSPAAPSALRPALTAPAARSCRLQPTAARARFFSPAFSLGRPRDPPALRMRRPRAVPAKTAAAATAVLVSKQLRRSLGLQCACAGGLGAGGGAP